ncbi:MAG: tyrosine--tRNA ligase [Alphaproteobacteria bacterium]|nr:tyrosine--tRNA ligase [Alphaproteobacteria bacterium]
MRINNPVMTYKSDFLNILDERGFIHQCSNFEALDDKLMEGSQSAYIGFDATAKSLHVGNLTGIMMLRWFQECGHKPITLMGGGTSKIGDPSFKDEQRKLLDDATINENINHIQSSCFEQFLTYGEAPNEALMVNNNDWLDGLKYLDFLRDYGRHFTVNRMLSFDSVKTRLERESPLSLLEFNYMVMQGYDFVELNKRYSTILQMGGSDQWGNIINGVELGHKAHQMKLFALTAPLLTTPDGAKMGKTVSGAVWLNKDLLSPYDYYQFWRNADDVMVGTLLKRFTMLSMDEIGKLEALQGAEINEAKKVLAFEATKMCHGERFAKEAETTAQKVFEQGSVGDNLPTIEVAQGELEKGMAFIDLFVASGLASTKSEVKRLIKGGGAKCNDNSVSDMELVLKIDDLTEAGYIKLSSGKKRHALVKVVP